MEQSIDKITNKPLFFVHVDATMDSGHVYDAIVCHDCMDKLAATGSIVSEIRKLTPQLCGALDLMEEPSCDYRCCHDELQNTDPEFFCHKVCNANYSPFDRSTQEHPCFNCDLF